ncbi:hypothetical protein J1G18_27070 [Pseudomonas sp. MIS38]|nr:hypothetical protein [Pseudomonas sp. MIS38]MBY8960967.1 hypothetical protein [Pseudomonas sp. MIS38]
MSSTSLKPRVEDFKSYPVGGKISESVELLEGKHTEARVFITMGLSDNNCTVTPEPSLKAELYGQGREDYFGYGLTLKEGSATSAKLIGHVSFPSRMIIYRDLLLEGKQLEGESLKLFEGEGDFKFNESITPKNGKDFDEVRLQMTTTIEGVKTYSFTLRTISFTLKDNHPSKKASLT